MKTSSIVLALLLIAGLVVGSAIAQEDIVDRVTVQLTNPSEPAFLKVGLINGGITVIGYEGNEFIVEARTSMKQLLQSQDSNKKSSGMTRIPVSGSSITVEEYRNQVKINTESFTRSTDLVVKVPFRTSLDLTCVNQGDIRVENITGDIEASNTNGSVTLSNISGSAVAHAFNKDLTVTFNEVDPEKAMSFSSFNGDVDVTFPANLKAKVKIKTQQGDIFSDFQIKEIENPEKVIKKNMRDTDGKYQVSIERSFWGLINNGSREIQFTNYNGDIYIRKLK